MSWSDVPAYWKRRIQRRKEWRTVAVNEQREREKKLREAAKNERRREIVAALETIDRKAQAKAEREQSKHLDPKWWQDRRFLLDAAGIVIAAGVGWIFWRQENIMQGQFDVLQRQLHDQEVEEEASVTIENLTVKGFPDNVTLYFDVRNSGRSRAEELTLDPSYIWTDRAG